MAKWTAEVSVRQVGKSYYKQPPTFVTVDAGNYAAACGAAAREARKRIAENVKNLRVEAVLVKVTREKDTV
jgi:hypothetical protein